MPLLYGLDTGPNVKIFMVACWFVILKRMWQYFCFTILLGRENFRDFHLELSTKKPMGQGAIINDIVLAKICILCVNAE